MEGQVIQRESDSPETTTQLGRLWMEILKQGLPSGPVRVALSGPLGAGKTHLAKGLFTPWGVDPARVVSPSFTLINEYDDGLSHLDLYRLKSWEDLETLGLEELLETARVVVIEWAQRFDLLERWGLEFLEIRLDYAANAATDGSDLRRQVVVNPHGPAYHSLISRLASVRV